MCGDDWTPVDGQIAFDVDRRLRNPANWQTVTEPGAKFLPNTARKISRSRGWHSQSNSHRKISWNIVHFGAP